MRLTGRDVPVYSLNDVDRWQQMLEAVACGPVEGVWDGLAVVIKEMRAGNFYPEKAEASEHCESCGRAIYRDGDTWLAVKGVERGYDPRLCDAIDDGKHNPPENNDYPTPPPSARVTANRGGGA